MLQDKQSSDVWISASSAEVMIRRMPKEYAVDMIKQCETHQHIVPRASDICMDECINCCGRCGDISAAHVLMFPRYLLCSVAAYAQTLRLKLAIWPVYMLTAFVGQARKVNIDTGHKRSGHVRLPGSVRAGRQQCI